MSLPLCLQALQQDTLEEAWRLARCLLQFDNIPTVNSGIMQLLAPGGLLERSLQATPQQYLQAAADFALHLAYLRAIEEFQEMSTSLPLRDLVERLPELAVMGAAMAATTVLLPCTARHLWSSQQSPFNVDGPAASSALESTQIGLAGEESRADAACAPHAASSSQTAELCAANAMKAVRPIWMATDVLKALLRLTSSDYWRSFDHAAELKVMLH